MEKTKYKLHYRTYFDFKSRTKTYTRLESALSDLEAFRNGYERETRDNGMTYYDGSDCSEKSLAQLLAGNFYIEKITIKSRILDY